jgi:gas vesicle protein
VIDTSTYTTQIIAMLLISQFQTFKNTEIMNTGKVLLGVLAGVATGVALGVLLAPEKGSDTREKLSSRGKEYADSVKDKFDKFKGNVAGKFEKVKADVSQTV